MKSVAIIRDPVYLCHSNGPMHPESPERLVVIDRMLSGFVLKERLIDIPARDATFAELARVHQEGYIRRIERTRQRSYTVLDPDTSACADSYAAAIRAAGGTLAAVEAVLSGQASSAFAFVRPPGHHAEADRAMGFCLFNNVAIASLYALRRHALERILIVDWDVHHGNGTMHTFYDSSEVLYFSVHQYPHYPGSGEIGEIGRNRGRGYTVNVPLSGGKADADYVYVFQEVLLPVAREFSPQLILVSAGFDTHRNDPLAGMALTSDAYGRLTAMLQNLSTQCCADRIVLTLEGGYDHAALSEGIASVLRSLIQGPAAETDAETHVPASAVDIETREVADKVRTTLSPYWEHLSGR